MALAPVCMVHCSCVECHSRDARPMGLDTWSPRLYRSLYSEFERLGVQVLGCSTQPPAYHREFIDRNHLPFGIVSDSDLQLVRALRLPTFEAPFVYGDEPTTLIKRMAWVVLGGRIAHVEYPVFPPDRNASVVLDWLRQHLGQEASS